MINTHGIPANQLRSFIESVERLEEEKKCIQNDIKDVKSEAKSMGYDVKTINQIIKDRRITDDRLAEQEALLDIYRAALGMLHDTPLGEAARRQLSGKSPAKDPTDTTEKKEDIKVFGDKDITVDKAQEMGFEAAKDGAKVIDNPFIAGDPRRGAWDQGWCKAAGHDGMEIPDTWRRATKKPGDGDGKATKGTLPRTKPHPPRGSEATSGGTQVVSEERTIVPPRNKRRKAVKNDGKISTAP
ncbi:MAG: hypothetical protein COB49_00625 [Alphaproteobacteria bacterium]|nr:MAG: hypothetical protein COB49_00625 [Alphaproteobacteria bacterium]